MSNHILNSRAIVAATALLTAWLLTAIGSPQARADFGLTAFDGTTLDSGGDPFTQAGGHPDAVNTGFEVAIVTDPVSGGPIPDGQFKDVVVDLAPGVVGDPSVTPAKCTAAQLASGDFGLNCPAASRIGTASITNSAGFTLDTGLYNMVPRPGSPAQFGFNLLVLLQLEASIRSDDHGLTISARNTPQSLPLGGFAAQFWGVPADRNPAITERKPFLRQPTSCTGPMETSIRLNQWEDFDNWITGSFLSHDNATPPNPIGQTGCENVPFSPSVNSQPTTAKADSPTGLAVDISIPDDGIKNPDGISQSDLKDVTMTFPEGMAVNPAAADGLGACSEAQIALGEDERASCPDNSKIGTVEMTTPVLAETLTGSVYQAEQDENPFNSTLAIYINAVNEERGIDIKLAGEVKTDPNTGRLTAVFKDNPQLPLEDMHLVFKAGSRAPLVTPPTCGTYEITTELTPWSAADPDNPTPEEVVTQTSQFTIDRGPDGGPCLAGDPDQPGDPADLAQRPFEPQMSSGVTSPVAGAQTPFVFRLTRQDGHQEILSTQVTPPEGVTAKLAGIPFCTDANAAAGTCGPESKVGTAITGAGAGPNPFYITNGEVFIAGPYKGAPLSLVIEVPAVAGPFDLGEVVVRAAVHVDPRTAQLTVVSDEIPQILEGIPLRVKDIRIVMDRDQFTIAPTDCSEMQVAATVQGSHGATAELQNRFQVGDCAALAFSPKLRFRAKEGRRATKRNFHPTLEATVNYPPSQYDEGGMPQANIDRVAVTLPKGMFLDQDNLSTICTRAQFAENECPESTRVGDAEAHTPLLDEPLSGPVYLIASDNQLPDLVADLNGTIEIDLYGRIDQSKRRIRNTFEVVPDAPVSDFRLTIDGGRNEGLLVNSRNTCRRKALRRVNVRVFGQNGATAHQRTQVKAPCKAKKRKLRRKARQLRRKAHRLDRRGDEARAQKMMRRAHKVARRAKRA